MKFDSQQYIAVSRIFGVLSMFAVLALVWFVLLNASCSKAPEIPQATAKVYSAAEIGLLVPGATCGDSAYAEVNSAWLHAYYDEFLAEIFKHGVTKWDGRFDCNHFANYYAALAQTKFYLANFHSSTKARSLAVGSYWYVSKAGSHAVVFALTERGVIWIEPQTGSELVLSPAEQASAFLKFL